MSKLRFAVVAGLAAALLPWASCAQAQVYKCQEGGRTVFSDTPCSLDAERVQVRPATGEYDPEAGARVRQETAETLSRFAAEDAARQAAREESVVRRAAERAAGQDRCIELRKKKNDAEYWANEFRHPDNIRREQQKAKHWKDRLWWECKQVN